MLNIEIPGREPLALCHLVLDYNGTIAVAGKLLPELAAPLGELSRTLEVHVLTADTYGTAAKQCGGLGVKLHTFPREGAGRCKEEIVRALGDGVVCMGNGFNDIPMFRCAGLSIAVLLEEGMCAGLLAEADVLVRSALDGLDLLRHPDRLRATLRN